MHVLLCNEQKEGRNILGWVYDECSQQSQGEWAGPWPRLCCWQSTTGCRCCPHVHLFDDVLYLRLRFTHHSVSLYGSYVLLLLMLGRLFIIDLIKPISNVCLYICLSTKSFFDFNEIWHVGSGWWVMHDGMQYYPIQGQGHDPLKVGNPFIFKSCLLCHLQWELATDHWFLNLGTISNFIGPDFWYLS